MSTNCYCGQPKPYATCCEPLHSGERLAQTAEQLMRSRYSAFCVHCIDYLLATHHPSQHAADERDSLQQNCQQQRWVHLDIKACHQGGKKDQRGEVEFVAWHTPTANTLEPALQQLHERSRFIREDGQWLYVDGDILPTSVNRQPNLGRNAPCWCGSGTKFKHCHLR